MRHREAIASALGMCPSAIPGVTGIQAHHAHYCVINSPQGPVFCKWTEHSRPGQFHAESTGLIALSAANTGLFIPHVFSAHDSVDEGGFLLLEYLPNTRRALDFDDRLGHGLAELHRNGSENGFGFMLDGYCGASPQPNKWHAAWASFYATQRLLHQVELGRQRGLDCDVIRAVDKLLNTLPDRLGTPEPPALIHGDLWAGNVLVSPQGGPALIDPAAYYGHREAELGMMVLFGGFGERVFHAYDEIYPLQPGWRERLPIYTLYHVLNHFTLFGGGYQDQARQILKELNASSK